MREDDDNIQHYAPLLRLQGRVQEIALELRCPDGRKVPVLINAVVTQDQASPTRITRITIFDATDRREYERELLRARVNGHDGQRLSGEVVA